MVGRPYRRRSTSHISPIICIECFCSLINSQPLLISLFKTLFKLSFFYYVMRFCRINLISLQFFQTCNTIYCISAFFQTYYFNATNICTNYAMNKPEIKFTNTTTDSVKYRSLIIIIIIVSLVHNCNCQDT